MSFGKKQIIITVLIAFVILAVPGVIFGYPYFKTWQENREFLANSEIHDAFVAAMEKEAQIKNDPTRVETYLTAMNRYKSLGDITKDQRFYFRALNVADAAFKTVGTKSYLPYVNSSVIYMNLGDYAKADEMIKKSIEMAPGEAQLYLRQIELYRDFMKKTDAEVIAVYENAIQRLVNVLPVYNSYAAYLRDIGRLDESLDKYEVLHKAMPDNQLYSQAIDDLKAAIKNR